LSGNEIPEGGGALNLLASIDMSGFDQRIQETEILVACDVTNPLFGEEGASKVFGCQKGATMDMIETLDENLMHFSEIIKKQFNIDVAKQQGTGAAGGLGFALVIFCNANLKKGIDIVLDAVKLQDRILSVDIVITGEGRLDEQTIYGKVPIGVAKRAKKFAKPVYAIVGSIGEGAQLVYEHGIDAVMSCITSPMSLEEVIRKSPQLIEEAAERLFRIIKSSSKIGRSYKG
jgi:glycerate kinase